MDARPQELADKRVVGVAVGVEVSADAHPVNGSDAREGLERRVHLVLVDQKAIRIR